MKTQPWYRRRRSTVVNFLLIKLMVAGPMMVGSCCVAHFRQQATGGPVNVMVEIPAEDPKKPAAEGTQETEFATEEGEDSN
jgi:hypothetical protein